MSPDMPPGPAWDTSIRGETVILNAINRAAFYRVENSRKFPWAVEAVYMVLPKTVKAMTKKWRDKKWEDRKREVHDKAGSPEDRDIGAYGELFEFMYDLLEIKGYLWKMQKVVPSGHE